MRKCYANVNMLLRRLSKCSTPVKCYLFQTYCSNEFCASLSEITILQYSGDLSRYRVTTSGLKKLYLNF